MCTVGVGMNERKEESTRQLYQLPISILAITKNSREEWWSHTSCGNACALSSFCMSNIQNKKKKVCFTATVICRTINFVYCWLFTQKSRIIFGIARISRPQAEPATTHAQCVQSQSVKQMRDERDCKQALQLHTYVYLKSVSSARSKALSANII